MPKKKSNKKKNIPHDVTINDSANAPKPVARVRKSTAEILELAWDQIPDDDFDIVEGTNLDGTKSLVYTNKHSNVELDIEGRPSHVYPEIVWYLISSYIKPEQIGTFAQINKATYAITRRESFWKALYKRYCQNHPNLPERLKIENNFKVYGLRQRVIRALYHTYDVFIKRNTQQGSQDSRPHLLVKRRCINVWFCKGLSHSSIYFKFKKAGPPDRVRYSFIEELGRIDANPEEGCQVLQVICQNIYEVPPLMGMTLSSASVVLSQGLLFRKLHLGFNSGLHSVSRHILPEISLTLDTVVNIYVFDWWNPNYPHFENVLPSNFFEEESVPVLKKDFFDD